MIVHVLDHGYPLCMFTDRLPCDWPQGHVWVSKTDIAHAGTDVCGDCVREHKALEAVKVGKSVQKEAN